MKEKIRRRLMKQLHKDPDSINSVLHKHKELRHLTVDIIREEDLEPGDKLAKVGKTGKYIPVKQVSFSDDVVDAIYHTLAHMAAIRDAHFKLRDTPFYSSEMERLFDKVSSTKMMAVFNQNDARAVSDDVVRLAKRFSDDCEHHRQLSKQPKKIQDRFYQKFKDLLIESGITVITT